MARIRTFIAVELAKPLRDRLVALQEGLARTTEGVKWVDPANLHVTLVFLGEAEDRAVPAICSLVQEAVAGIAPFTLELSGVGCFPNPRRPRVVWAGVGQGSEELVRLHQAISAPLEELGYRREERRYTPHVTLGRINSDRVMTDRLTAAIQRNAAWEGGTTAISEIHVMSSELRRDGPQYTILGRASLG